jgi:hypothetical protein
VREEDAQRRILTSLQTNHILMSETEKKKKKKKKKEKKLKIRAKLNIKINK